MDNDQNRNTINIAPTKLLLTAEELDAKCGGFKSTPKRSMKQLNKLLLIKSEEKDSDNETEELPPINLPNTQDLQPANLCPHHNCLISLFCPQCLSYLFCQQCQHPHPLTQYPTLQSCLSHNLQPLSCYSTLLHQNRTLANYRLTQLQQLSSRIQTSKSNIFKRIRKFVDDLESVSDLQINRILTEERGKLIAYEKGLRRVLCGDADGVLERILTTDIGTMQLQERMAESECDGLLDRLRGFCHGLRSPLAKQVNIQLMTDRANQGDELETTNRTHLETTRPSSVSKRMNNTATLEKRILESILDSQRKDRKKENSNFLKTLNLLGGGKERLTIDPKRIKFF